ncbi:hypothetical protein ACFE04_011312 [Oxalis oulophora]
MELQDIKKKVYLKVPREHWCKVFFSTRSECDIVDNNLTKAFNAHALEAKGMPVVLMFEIWRVNSIIRNKEKLKKAEKRHHDITLRHLDDYKDKTRFCKLLFGVRGGWEV